MCTFYTIKCIQREAKSQGELYECIRYGMPVHTYIHMYNIHEEYKWKSYSSSESCNDKLKSEYLAPFWKTGRTEMPEEEKNHNIICRLAYKNM